MFRKNFKIIEKILLSNQRGISFLEAINDLRPPIFFKEKPFFLSQCKLWSFKKINLIQDTKSGVWVSGLPSSSKIITVGQDYVNDGEKVNFALDQRLNPNEKLN